MAQLLGPDPIAATDPALTVLRPGARLKATQTGYMLLPPSETLSPDLQRFLDAGPPPVYAGFGSMPVGNREGVSRMLVLGAEPVSLASALTLGVGQRVVRTNCPNCSLDQKVTLSDMIPGAQKGMTTRKGSGCPNCQNSGYSGATGIFEVLPFTDPVRAQISRGASADTLEAAARSAGMRSMIASGLTKVRDGLVSPEELDRVLRFSS